MRIHQIAILIAFVAMAACSTVNDENGSSGCATMLSGTSH